VRDVIENPIRVYYRSSIGIIPWRRPTGLAPVTGGDAGKQAERDEKEQQARAHKQTEHREGNKFFVHRFDSLF
jgi:phosphoribosylaminoimidazole (AIR) synthetase